MSHSPMLRATSAIRSCSSIREQYLNIVTLFLFSGISHYIEHKYMGHGP